VAKIRHTAVAVMRIVNLNIHYDSDEILLIRKLVRKQGIKLIYMVLCEDFIKFDVSTNQKCSREPSVLSFLSESLLNTLKKNIDNAWGWR